MYQINSIIFEGNIVGERIKSCDSVKFTVENTCNGGAVVPVVATGDNANAVMDIVSSKSGVRVVGFLRSMKNNLYIKAEHVEIKPTFDTREVIEND